MTLGHASMAVETPFIYWNWVSFIGNGLFKPNMTSIISNAYKYPEKKRRCLFNVLHGCECSFLDYVVWVY
jgi:dipeptide/tripeptide permease